MASESRILFVYNADSGLMVQLKDYVLKIVAPRTYPCNLCQITYGNLGMRRAWRRFVRDLSLTAVFLHRDELTGRYATLLAVNLPAVFVDEGGEISTLVTAEELNRTPDMPALQALVSARLEERTPTLQLA